MIQKFVDKFMAGKPQLEKVFAAKHPVCYADIVKEVIRLLSTGETYGWPDPESIHEIDDGHYQGTLLYVIAELGYQPNNYWYVRVGYGSCSGCDTLEAIIDFSSDKPSPQQINDYMTLALHIVEGLHSMEGETV